MEKGKAYGRNRRQSFYHRSKINRQNNNKLYKIYSIDTNKDTQNASKPIESFCPLCYYKNKENWKVSKKGTSQIKN